MSNDLLKAGRAFLVLLHKTEEIIRQQETTRYPSTTILQIRNWKCVLAFVLRKLSAFLEGTTDSDFEIKKPYFKLVNQTGKLND